MHLNSTLVHQENLNSTLVHQENLNSTLVHQEKVICREMNFVFRTRNTGTWEYPTADAAHRCSV